ncbi:MAG: 16S rRNA (cytosine(1402)-N(4))-methyltransferase RsmH [Pseudomonadota bacterium]
MTQDAPHIPVMLSEVMEALAPQRGETVVDATFGAGGYTRAILGTGASVIAIDRDPSAIEAGQGLVAESDGKLRLVEDAFSNLAAITPDPVDAIVADIGVSSMQIDQGERGFSFQADGPLDMRMGGAGAGAADVIANAPRNTLTRIIGLLGEERQANRIAAEIASVRDKQPITTTLQLAAICERVLGRKAKINPATRTFQALRIYVNRELHELADALLAAEQVLKPGGRLVVVSFHSLEDRLVKRFLLDRAESAGGSRHMPVVVTAEPTFALTKRNAISAGAEEAQLNPRARSAKLRFAIRTEAAPRSADHSVFNLPNLPDPQDFAA